MRRISAFAAVAALCGALAPVASAGTPTIDANGNVLMLDAQFNTPATSSSRTAQGAVFEMHHFYGNFRGNPTPTEASNISFNYPKGTVINSALFARCPVPTQETFGVESRCPPASKVGSGTISVDARRSGISGQLNGTVNVYNGAQRNGVYTVAVMATIPIPGAAEPIRSELDFEIRKGPQLVEFDTLPPAPDGSASFDITSFNLLVGKTVNGVVKGRRAKISYFVTPKTCTKKGWSFELGLTRSNGNTSAKDTAPCLRVVG